ncbi:hypothetical protein ABIF70_005220 [Bradyrhizobium japonicum]
MPLAEICLQLAGPPLEWRLHRIVRKDGVASAELLAAERADPGWDPVGQKKLNTYQRNDPALVAEGRALFVNMSKGKVGEEWRRLAQQHGTALRTSVWLSAPGTDHIPCELAIAGMELLVLKGPFTRTNLCPTPEDEFNPVWPVRILVVNAADPKDTAIRAEEEIWKIREALRAAYHSFDLEVYDTASDPKATPAGILAAMKRWPGGPHILHFIGHSVPSELKLYFASGDQYSTWSLMMIAAAVSQFPQLRLVYVNACRSNVANDEPASPWSVADAFLGTAVAVIAMQADISGKAAQICADAFYRGLAANQTLNDAFHAARHALLIEFGEESVEVYAPVLTARVSDRCILPTRRFNFPAARHENWQNSLSENWAHFVNQHAGRRSLMSALCEPEPETKGVVVWGETAVGKSWLVNWASYAMALNGVQFHYVDATDAPDWLELLRIIRDGKGSLVSPGLDTAIASEFNWKLNHLAQGQPPPAYVAIPGQPVVDTAGAHPVIMASGRAINGFDGLVCEAFVHALRQQALTSPRVLVLDNPSRPVTAILKKPLFDVLAQNTSAEPTRIVLCCGTELWKVYQEQALDFSAWSQIHIGFIEPSQITRLIRELLRLQFPVAARDRPQDFASVESMLAGVSGNPPPMPAGDLYRMCNSFGRIKGLHG